MKKTHKLIVNNNLISWSFKNNILCFLKIFDAVTFFQKNRANF